MTRAARSLVFWAGLSAAVAVAAGAFGAHGLRTRLDPADLAVFETAARYHMYHALGGLAAAWLFDRTQARAALWSGWLFLGGTVVFSGSLYTLCLTGQRWLGAITPLGGVGFIAGWVLLAMASRDRAPDRGTAS